MAATPRDIRIQAVVFDLDDTLYAERDYVRSGYRAVARCLRQSSGPREDFEGWLWRRFEAGQAGSAMDALNEHFALGLAPPELAELVAVYRAHRPDIRPRPGAVELLQRLRASGRRLGLLSDGFLPAQQLKLDALGLAPLLDAVVFTEQLGRTSWKPSPAGFDAIGQTLGAAGDACAYVGDNVAKDFLAPNALGWRTIRLACAQQVHAGTVPPEGGAPQIVIAALDELDAALD